jgi:hypothetical protein
MSGDLFIFDGAEAERLIDDGDLFMPTVSFNSDADDFHSCVVAFQEHGAITGPAGAGINVYPQSAGEPTPLLVVNNGRGLSVLGSELSYPDGELAEPKFTLELLANLVDAANMLLLEVALGTAPAAVLDHTYRGTAIRICGGETTPGMGQIISGAFRVLTWLPTGGAVIGNGESPESVWATLSAPERVA